MQELIETRRELVKCQTELVDTYAQLQAVKFELELQKQSACEDHMHLMFRIRQLKNVLNNVLRVFTVHDEEV